MDDFYIKNEKAYCTMQAVKEATHKAIGQTHSASPKLWEFYYGIPYK